MKLEREQLQHTLANLTIQSKANSFDLPKINNPRFIEQDFCRFEQHMEAYTIPPERLTVKLIALLKDDALCVYLSIPTINSDKYDVIKSTLLGRVGITSLSRLQHLLKLSPKHEESAAHY